MAEESAAGAQPAEGQGEGGSELYQQALENVPEELRGHVEPHFKEWDSNVTKKLQEASEYRKQWEPYEQLGVNQLPPEELSGLFEFAQMAQNPDQLNEWAFSHLAEQGIIDPEQMGGEQEGQEGQQYLTPDDAQAMMGQMFEQFQQHQQQQQMAQQQEQQTVQEINDEIDQTVGEISQQDGEFFGQHEDLIRDLAIAGAEGNPEASPSELLQNAYQRAKQIAGNAERGVLQGKLSAPPTPEQGGQPNTAGEQLTSFGPDLHAQALERLKQGQQ